MIEKNSILQFNKFAEMHDGNKIFFCKTDFIIQCFEKIKKINNEVILITGNSDYCIFYKNDTFILKDLNNNILTVFKRDFLPSNLKLWFAANNCTNLSFIKCLPIGIENNLNCILPGHGIGWEHATEKVKILCEKFDNPNFESIDSYFYFNNNINTNLKHRLPIKNYLLSKNINVESETLNFNDFVNNCQKHKAVICPAGNGIDTHKFYEVLMIRRIPIIIKLDSYSIYDDFYKMFPCIIIDNIEKLFDDNIFLEIDYKIKNFDDSLLDIKYWKNYILNVCNF